MNRLDLPNPKCGRHVIRRTPLKLLAGFLRLTTPIFGLLVVSGILPHAEPLPSASASSSTPFPPTSPNAARNSTPAAAPTWLLVVGAPGEATYSTNFARQATVWSDLAQRIGARSTTVGLDPAQTNDLERVEQLLGTESRDGAAPLLLVLIGHGTFDGREAKFNLRGPDLTTTNLITWLAPFQRPVAVIHTGSASAPYLNRLSRTNRVLVSATRTGTEHNATRFGGALADALVDPKTDLDLDGETSLLEAFLSAAARVAEFYKTEGRLATEHPLIDDNGDRQGTPADWFRGTRATKKTANGASSDGLGAHQFALIPGPEGERLSPESKLRRDELERIVAQLRDTRPANPGDDYYDRLEAVLLELAQLLPPVAAPVPESR